MNKINRKIGLIMLASILLSAAEVAYINSTPLLGEGDIDSMMTDYEKIDRLNVSSEYPPEEVSKTNQRYQQLYSERPHTGDIAVKTIYKYPPLELGITDVMMQGVVLWKMDVFDSNSLYPIYVDEVPRNKWFSFSEIMNDTDKQKEFFDRYSSYIDDAAEIKEIEFSVEDKEIILSRNNSLFLRLYYEAEGFCSIEDIEEDRFSRIPCYLVIGDVEVDHPIPHGFIIGAFGPKASASEIYPEVADYAILSSRTPWKNKELEKYPGRRLTLMSMGWITLMDSISSNSILLFDDRIGGQLNLTHEEFLQGYAEMSNFLMARLSFVESVIDERPAWDGIYYSSYYPRYNKTFVFMKGITKKDLFECKAYIDNIEAQIKVYPPFIFLDGNLGEGNHTIKIVTPKKTYETVLNVKFTPFTIIPPSISLRDGKITFYLDKADPTDQTILIKDLEMDWAEIIELKDNTTYLGNEVINKGEANKEINQELRRNRWVEINASLPAVKDEGNLVDANLTINYIQEGLEKQYETKILIEVEASSE